MKLILLAAAASIAVPAGLSAQTTPGQTMPTPATDPATAPAPTDQQTAPSPAPGPDQSQAAPMGQGQQPMSTGTPAGGYQPNGSAMQGTMSPGATPTYQAAPSPSQAYPAPAPKDSYPVCKKGQYDGCMEPGGANGGGKHHARRHRK